MLKLNLSNFTSKTWQIIGVISTIIIGIVAIIYSNQSPSQTGKFNVFGNNNAIYIYSQKERDQINEEVKIIKPSEPLADIIVKINASTSDVGIPMEYEYIRTLKCGTNEQGAWGLISQGVLPRTKDGLVYETLYIECSSTGEEKIIYFDITDWYGIIGKTTEEK